jgi:hypothetical protein
MARGGFAPAGNGGDSASTRKSGKIRIIAVHESGGRIVS